ncbi:cytospin-A isoform X1 [Electrophorus electricus]|uniref:Cytospin-A n=1 Tax=Electrophorus electricus TaxID=8005 RepID=A0A4W4GUV3_ELEEL|nr:cytospin-A isoform X1 [Electrophorus electricus]
MGNYSAKERNGAPGSPLDLYHSPPISPQTLTSPGNPTHSDTNSTSDRTSSPVTDPASTAIGPRGRLSLDKTGSVSVKVGSFPISPPRHGRVEVRSLRRSLTDTTPTERSQVSASPVQVAPPTVAWSDPGAQVDRGLLQECVVALGLSTAEEKSHTLTDILKCFLSEREQMKEELRSLMEKIQAERSEWLQFQSDLQVALVVADRLRAEAEEEMTTLREARHDWEKQLAEAQQRRQEVEGQMQHLKVELEQSRQRQNQGGDPPGQNGAHLFRGREGGRDGCLRSVGMSGAGRGEHQEGDAKTGTAERPRSLSRLPSDSPTNVVNGISQTSVALKTRSVRNNNNLTRERLTLDQQDNLVNLCKDKKEENPSLPLSSSPLIDLPNKVSRTKPSEDLNTLLRRHGGSKRNSLLRWCQARTNGYQNIEITNFSSSWVDGLAFCAVYHTYLPTYIPYNTLSPENKRENLLLAFQTGQEVGIAASLTVEEMMKVEGPDWQRVLGYVESVYRHFEM